MNSVEVFGVPKDRAEVPIPKWELTLPGADREEARATLQSAAGVGSLTHQTANEIVEVESLGSTKKEADWTIKVQKGDVAASLARLQDLVLLCHYSVAMPTRLP